jgi:hypothetical protein
LHFEGYFSQYETHLSLAVVVAGGDGLARSKHEALIDGARYARNFYM